MTGARKDQMLITRKSPLVKVQLLLIVGLVVVSGLYLVSRIYAATGTLSLIAGSGSVNIGDTVVVAVRENSGTDPVNAVQANIAFDSTKLQYMGVSETGSAFGLMASTQAGVGSLQLARATSGGAAPVTGDNLVVNVSFKALTAGPVALTFTTGSAVLRSTDNVDILTVSNGATLLLADTAAPGVPVGLTAPTTTLTSISLAWTASTDNVAVLGYRVFQNGIQIATTATPSYTSASLAPGTVYTYRVAAYDAAGNLSAQSMQITPSTLADTAAPTVPGKPTSSSQTMTSITLAWTASTDNVGVSGYRVFRNGVQVSVPTTTTFNDVSLAINTSYSYSVAAVDAVGNVSAQSAATTVKTLADTAAPSVPAGLSGVVTGSSIALTWTASTDNAAVTGYIVYRDGVQIATPTGTGYTVANAPSGSHTYTVAARDAAGNVSAASTGVVLQVFIASDVNRDGKVDVFDLSSLLTNWSRTGANASDVNGDGVVNIFDLSILLSNWTG